MRPSDSKTILFSLWIAISPDFKRYRWIFFVFKNKDLKYFRDKNIYVEICLPPITATSKRPWFWRFFAFSWKTREIFVNYFLIYHRKWLKQFFPVLLRGSSIMFHWKSSKKTENGNFLNIHQTKKRDYEALTENEYNYTRFFVFI